MLITSKKKAYTSKTKIAHICGCVSVCERVSDSYRFCCLFSLHLSKVVNSSWSNVATLSACFLLITFQILFTIASLCWKYQRWANKCWNLSIFFARFGQCIFSFVKQTANDIFLAMIYILLKMIMRKRERNTKTKQMYNTLR